MTRRTIALGSAILPGALTLFVASFCLAQPARTPTRKPPARSTRVAAHRQQVQKPESKWVFGDIMLVGYTSFEYTGTKVVAEGPNTVVTAVDPKNGGVTRINANRFVATMGKNKGVDKIEAIGSVRFYGERPTPDGKGKRVLTGTGSHGIYYKQEGRLVLEGPVTYDVKQPNVKGQEEWARGTADSAAYDENKRILTLKGDVHAKFFDPENMEEGKPGNIDGDQVTIDFSGDTVRFYLKNNSPNSGQIHIRPKPSEKKETPKEKGKP